MLLQETPRGPAWTALKAGGSTIRAMGVPFRDLLWPGLDDCTGTDRKIRFPLRPRVDYLFVSDRLKVQTARVLRQSAGDHHPVAATLRIKPQD